MHMNEKSIESELDEPTPLPNGTNVKKEFPSQDHNKQTEEITKANFEMNAASYQLQYLFLLMLYK